MSRQHSLALLLFTSTLHATPINISAGFASIDQNTHEHLFRQEVQIDDDHQHLRAAWVKVTTDQQNQLVQAVAHGDHNTAAHLWSTEKEPSLHAYANEIQYYPKEHRVILTGNAHLAQGKNSFSAPKITYNTLTQHIVSEAQGDQRTTIILDQDHDALIR